MIFLYTVLKRLVDYRPVDGVDLVHLAPAVVVDVPEVNGGQGVVRDPDGQVPVVLPHRGGQPFQHPPHVVSTTLQNKKVQNTEAIVFSVDFAVAMDTQDSKH